MIFSLTGRARDFRIHAADVVERVRENRHCDRARLAAVRVRVVVVVALAACDGADDQPNEEQYCSDSHFYLRKHMFRWSGVPDGYLVISGQRRDPRRGTDHFVPTPARWRARQASPTSSRLVGEKTALVAVEVALIRNAMMNRTAATKPSIPASFRLVAQVNKGPGILQAGWPGGQPCRPGS